MSTIRGGMKKHNLAFIDLETTGTNPEKHEITEIGCIIAKQVPRAGRGPSVEKIEEFEMKVKPEHIETAEPEALRISGYNEQDWLFAVDLKQAIEELSKKIEGSIIVGQNISFDWSFLERAFIKTGIYPDLHYHKLDTMGIAFTKFYDNPEIQKLGLYSLCEQLGVTNEKAHTALSDIRATFEVYKKLLDA